MRQDNNVVSAFYYINVQATFFSIVCAINSKHGMIVVAKTICSKIAAQMTNKMFVQDI